MKKILYILLIFSALATSCGNNKNAEATAYLENIHTLYNNGKYAEALVKIDSFQAQYPKAFDEIKASLAFKEDVRIALNKEKIATCDSLLANYDSKIDSLKQFFIYKRDKEDAIGFFAPKAVPSNTITTTLLRSGVNDEGTFFIESVYTGGQIHTKIGVATKDKQSAESLTIEDDGLNFRFSNLGQQYEVIRITPIHDNGLAQFIITNLDKPLTVQLKGKNTLSYTLSDVQKKAISDSYKLSSWMHQKDSIKTAKDKAQTLINYVESKKVKNDSINESPK